MRYLLIGYMWLFVHRPFEVWPWLATMRIERVFMLLTLAFWFLFANKSWTRNRLNLAFVVLFLAIVLSWLQSPHHEVTTKVVEDYAKVGVFYVLLLSCVRDEKALRFMITAFLACTALYMVHSLREYLNGRYVWRMGTARMIGVDTTFGDPNSFGASLVYALPLTIPFWRTAQSRRDQWLLAGYTALAVTCILLTGSRSAFVGLGVIVLLLIAMSRYRWRLAVLAVILAPIVWLLLPEDRQNRYLTLIDPSRGPRNAQKSAEGRTQGFYDGLRNWRRHPVFGVGPGAHGRATGNRMQAHNLYGQLAGELGTIGIVAFLIVLSGFVANYWRARLLSRRLNRSRNSFPFLICQTVLLCVGLLLLMGWGGHNLYRYTWLWYGAFQVLALGCVSRAALSATEQMPPPNDDYTYYTETAAA